MRYLGYRVGVVLWRGGSGGIWEGVYRQVGGDIRDTGHIWNHAEMLVFGRTDYIHLTPKAIELPPQAQVTLSFLFAATPFRV